MRLGWLPWLLVDGWGLVGGLVCWLVGLGWGGDCSCDSGIVKLCWIGGERDEFMVEGADLVMFFWRRGSRGG